MPPVSARAVFLAFLRLGLTSFGGPVAHLGYFRKSFVIERGWLDDARYGDIVALCQILPGPASSQVGMMIGLDRAGIAGALAAWLGFTLPSALLMTACAYGVGLAGGDTRWMHGLALVAVAVVAQAVLGMARMLCRDTITAGIALLAAAAALALPGTAGQDSAMLGGALAGALLCRGAAGATPTAWRETTDRGGPAAGTAITALLLFVALLFGLPALQRVTGSTALDLAAGFYRAGALVFGGGHVVLPLLAAETASHGVARGDLLAGYALAQAVPGPLFTVAAYLGALMGGDLPRGLGAVVALVAIFLPSFLLVVGVAPFWARWSRHAGLRSALAGVNAAVVGLLLAALYSPLATGAIHSATDAALAVLAFVLLTRFAVPAWLLVGLALVIWRLLPA